MKYEVKETTTAPGEVGKTEVDFLFAEEEVIIQPTHAFTVESEGASTVISRGQTGFDQADTTFSHTHAEAGIEIERQSKCYF